jgi:ribosome-binding factor A
LPSAERARKVARRIFEELSVLFQREVSDPRLSNITITDVDVDRELAYATVFVSTLDDSDLDVVMNALRGAQGFLRSQLAIRIPMRAFPHLRFRYDPTLAQGARIDELLSEISEELNSGTATTIDTPEETSAEDDDL